MTPRDSGRTIGRVAGTLITLVVVAAVAAQAGAHAPVGHSPATPEQNHPSDAGETNVTTVSPNVRELVSAARAGDVGPRFVSRSGDGIVVDVTVEVAPEGEAGVRKLLESHGTVGSRFGGSIAASLPPDAIEAVAGEPGVESIRKPEPVVGANQGDVVSEGLSAINVSGELHDAGVNGSGVTVAVVDTGFNVSNTEIDHHVAGFEDFEGDGMDNETSLHGTAVAELVIDTAPEASIRLYEVETSTQVGSAVEHITQNTSVDVATMSLGVLTGPFDGASEIDRAIDDSVANGTAWFVSAGNYADGQHYNQTWQDGDGDGLMNVSDTRESIEVDAGGGFTAYVSWADENAASEDYDVYLSRSGVPVANSTDTQDGHGRPVEVVSADASGEYTLRIERVDAAGTADFDVFVSGPATLTPATRSRSVVRPATAESVVAVGAVRYTDSSLRGFSSRGPTVDGRTKPELVGPDGVATSQPGGSGLNSFAGTSAATPHAAGVAALVLDGVTEPITADRVGESLIEGATPIGETVPNNRTGYGLLNATGALEAAGELTLEPAAFGVRNLTAPVAATAGKTVTVNATLANTGDVGGTTGVELLFDGAVRQTRSVSIEGNATERVGFDLRTGGVPPGNYTYGIGAGGSVETGVITLRAPPRFEVSELEAPASVVGGEAVQVVATVTNAGGVEGSTDIAFVFDGDAMLGRTVTLDAGGSTDLRFNVSTDDIAPGTYRHGVRAGNGSGFANITVQQPATFEVSTLDAPTEAIAGKNVTVNATVTNVGDVRGTTDVELLFAGDVRLTRRLTLAGGGSADVRFEFSTDGAPSGTSDHGVRTGRSNRTGTITLNARPVADIGLPTTRTVVNETATLNATGSADADGSVEAYEWDLDGDGAYDDATGPEVTAAFASPGERTVGLRVIDDDGLANETTASVTVLARMTPFPTRTVDTTATGGGLPGAGGEATGVSSTPRTDTDGTTADGQGLPGFGPPVALLALAVFVLFVRRVYPGQREP
jgi:subtilisin family serine protease